MKIPTLLGITLIIAIIGSLVYWFFYRQTIPLGQQIQVKELQAVNISDTSTTLVWQTNTPAFGEVNYGQTQKLGLKASDNRNRFDPKPRLTHFVTITNLKPDTQYFYKISSDSYFYPEKAAAFKTAPAIDPSNDLEFSFIKPLKGTILNTNLNPIDESLIFIKIPGAQNLATFSSTSGNFILPLKLVLSEDLSQVFFIPEGTPAKLSIKKGDLTSEVKILISDKTINLPPIPIGNNLDLENFQPQSITKISFGERTQIKLDFNNDSKINSLDLAMLRAQINSRGTPSTENLNRYDVNPDGILDQKDIDAFSKTLQVN